MNYTFPIIHTIDDVLPAIKDSPEFIIADKGDYTVINYVVSHPDTFPPVESEHDAIRRECRGIIFDSTSHILSRRYHKFFNISERDETQPHLVDISAKHEVLEKLDGSMVTPINLPTGIRWGTKMGLTEVGMNAEAFAYANPKYNEFAGWCNQQKLTPIFEWCSRKNRIVIDYPKDNLILTAVRHIHTGQYQTLTLAQSFGIPTIKTYNQIKDITQFIDTVRGETGTEGYVLRFANGHMLKFKSAEYVLLHKAKEVASSEHNIIRVIVEEKIDDLKSLLIKEDLDKVNEIEKRFWEGSNRQVERYTKLLEQAHHLSSGEKKRFAQEFASQVDKDDIGVLFQIWDGNRQPMDVFLNVVRKNVTKKMKYEKFKRKFL